MEDYFSMKYFKDRVDDFFKWVKGTELVIIEEIDVNEDPIRPHLDLNFRVSHGRQIYGLEYDGSIEGIVCIALTNEIPHTEKELELMSKNSFLEDNPSVMVPYTVWSRKRGAGKEIMKKAIEHVIKNMDNIERIVTLSPLTPMATHYHIRNGAKLISINSDTQNFEYTINRKK
tara:strand:+ start:525 stop:1043 length:519 start_codon:yes stop_codon:yes gene_type:complete